MQSLLNGSVQKWMAKALAVELIAVGTRDVILPGEMEDLLTPCHGSQERNRCQPPLRRGPASSPAGSPGL